MDQLINKVVLPNKGNTSDIFRDHHLSTSNYSHNVVSDKPQYNTDDSKNGQHYHVPRDALQILKLDGLHKRKHFCMQNAPLDYSQNAILDDPRNIPLDECENVPVYDHSLNVSLDESLNASLDDSQNALRDESELEESKNNTQAVSNNMEQDESQNAASVDDSKDATENDSKKSKQGILEDTEKKRKLLENTDSYNSEISEGKSLENIVFSFSEKNVVYDWEIVESDGSEYVKEADKPQNAKPTDNLTNYVKVVKSKFSKANFLPNIVANESQNANEGENKEENSSWDFNKDIVSDFDEEKSDQEQIILAARKTTSGNNFMNIKTISETTFVNNVKGSFLADGEDGVKETSAIEESDSIATKNLSIFKDVNPESDCRTAFVRRLDYAGGSAKLSTYENTPQSVIDKELNKNMQASGKQMAIKSEKEICFPILQRANPKGVSQTCEMCTAKASLCCSKCSVTYYCTWTHRNMDSLHYLICDRLKKLNWPIPFADNHEHRMRLNAQKLLIMENLLEDLVTSGFANLYAGKYTLAIGSFCQGIKFVPKVFGIDHEDEHLITIFTALSRAQLGRGQFTMAERALNNAHAHLSKAMEMDPPTSPLNHATANVFKTQGILNIERENYDEAIFNFSEYIYYTSEACSPVDVRACSGYFYLGKCFILVGREAQGFSTLSYCSELLLRYLGERFNNVTSDTGKSMFDSNREKSLSFFIELDVTEQLAGLLDIVPISSQPVTLFRIIVCRGILLYFKKKYRKARELASYCSRLEHKIPKKDIDVLLVRKNLEKHAARMEAFCNKDKGSGGGKKAGVPS